MNPAKGIRAEVELGNLSTDISRKNTFEGEGLEPHFEETNLLDACNGRKSEIIHISDDDERSIKYENVPFLRTIPEVSSFLLHTLQHGVVTFLGNASYGTFSEICILFIFEVVCGHSYINMLLTCTIDCKHC